MAGLASSTSALEEKANVIPSLEELDHQEAALLHSAILEAGRRFSEARTILVPVLVTIALTCTAWSGVYGCVPSKNVFFFGGNETLGSEFKDNLVNATIAMGTIVIITIVLLTLALRDYRRIVILWLSSSCIVASFAIAGSLFYDILQVASPLSSETSLTMASSLLAAVYGGGACVVFFTTWLPPRAHQIYVVTNCAAISVFYLNSFPGDMVWFLLCAILIWDLFAVLAPLGPLKLALEKSNDYGEDVLRFLMFTSRDGTEEPATIASEPTREELEQVPTAKSISAHSVQEDASVEQQDPVEVVYESVAAEAEPFVSARDALGTGSHLGLGDFIFFSLLVGKSLVVGLLPAVASTVAVSVGLLVTLNIRLEAETLPALPISVTFGLVAHFVTAHVALPFLAELAELGDF